MIFIRHCTVAEIEAAPELLAEYARESAMPELGQPAPRFPLYHNLQETGILHPIGGFDGNTLVGFILPVVAVVPHYGVLAVTVESFFVTQAARCKGLGLSLLQHAESTGRSMGAKALLLSAPTQSDLERVLEGRRSYRHSNSTYVKRLAE